jgi:hypothetical protein
MNIHFIGTFKLFSWFDFSLILAQSYSFRNDLSAILSYYDLGDVSA